MSENLEKRIAHIVRDAGGRIVGRTKLQKLTFVLVSAGLESEIPFLYKHYGPFSEAVASASRDAHLLGFLREKEDPTSWGGFYSTYTVDETIPDDVPLPRRQLASIANNADAVELELAATALFLAVEGKTQSVWLETERRKPDKVSGGRLERAKLLYDQMRGVATPKPLPVL